MLWFVFLVSPSFPLPLLLNLSKAIQLVWTVDSNSSLKFRLSRDGGTDSDLSTVYFPAPPARPLSRQSALPSDAAAVAD